MLVSRKYKSICPAPAGTFADLISHDDKGGSKIVRSHLPVLAFVLEERKYKEGNRVVPETSVEPVILDIDGDILQPDDLSRERLTAKLEVR